MTITINEPIDIDVQQVFKLLIEQYGEQGIAKEVLSFLCEQPDFAQANLIRCMIERFIKENE